MVAGTEKFLFFTKPTYSVSFVKTGRYISRVVCPLFLIMVARAFNSKSRSLALLIYLSPILLMVLIGKHFGSFF